MNEIKEFQKMLVVELTDWTILRSEKSMEEFKDYLSENEFLHVDWILFGRYQLKKAYEENLDELEQYIISQSKEIQDKLRTKRIWLKIELAKEMTLNYAQNYVKELLNS
jgi:hypothetical protein